MKKKLIALLLVLTVSAVGFTGCGNKEEAADAGNDADNAQVEEATDGETEDVAESEEVEEETAEEDEAALEEEQQTEDQTQEEVKPEEEKAPEKVEDKTEAKPETKPEAKPEVKPQDKPAKEEQTAKPETKPQDKPAKEETPASKPQTGNASSSSSSTSGSNGTTADQPQEEQGGNSSNAPAAGESAAQTLKSKFNSAIKSSKDLDTVANSIIADLPLATATMPVEEGYLNGFTDEIKGFNSGVMFGPMIGSIPFIGYVFETDDADALIKLLKSKADLRWNICTAADEMATAKSGNYVFFVMAPTTFEE